MEQPRDPIFGDLALSPTIVIAPGVELYVGDDGQVAERGHGREAIVGQLGMGIREFTKKNPLRAGTVTEWESVELSGATNGCVSGIIDGLVTSTVECPPSTVGDRLRRAMYARSMTVEVLIEESQLSKTTIYRLLNSKSERLQARQIDTVIALQDALHVPGWWLETGEGEPPDGNDRSEDHEG